ncbi:hypothetical protein [Kingella sp. (in: b-proteobacteria)]|uniref:hypothetical protein n=1 Tax=Kingella sp. (in: b-proteobacteria) TaxID=2020713 RepID=UPI0026DDC36F|nr:hypothetical protein [Kingella sp. (in: b-proteobacteria)]MDO4658192.1 hypothetical protein [Kingella sp. (in: b-proteobacteria)]
MKKPIPRTHILLALFSGSLKPLWAQTLSEQENYLYQPQAKTPIGSPAGASEPALPAPQGQPENAGAPPQTAQNKTRLNEDDLRADPQLAERLVNQAVLERQWDFLAALLPVYQSISAHNPTRYTNTRTASWRGQKPSIAKRCAILAKFCKKSPICIMCAWTT